MVTMDDIQNVAKCIARQFDPERIILFGSYAYGVPGPHSDVDYLVLLPFEGRSFWKSLDILNAVKPNFSVDLIARQPDIAHRRYVCGDPLIREAFDKGKVLYERSSPGMD